MSNKLGKKNSLKNSQKRPQGTSIVVNCSCGNTMEFSMSTCDGQWKTSAYVSGIYQGTKQSTKKNRKTKTSEKNENKDVAHTEDDSFECSTFGGSRIYEVAKQSTKKNKIADESDDDDSETTFDESQTSQIGSEEQSPEGTSNADQSVRCRSVTNKNKYVKYVQGDDSKHVVGNENGEGCNVPRFINSYPKALQNIGKIKEHQHATGNEDVEGYNAPQSNNNYPKDLLNIGAIPKLRIDTGNKNGEGSNAAQFINSYPKSLLNIGKIPARQTPQTL